jgi:hypothetical protein
MTLNERTQLLRQTILEQLKHAGSYLLPDSALIAAVKMICCENGLAVREQIKWLESENMIIQVENELRIVKWKITDLGRTVEI